MTNTAQPVNNQTVEPLNVSAAAAPDTTSAFKPLSIPGSPDQVQNLKGIEGNRFTEPFRVAGALVGRVFNAAYNMYDNARTDLRIASAAKEMKSFDPEKITAGLTARTILDTWSNMAEKNPHIRDHMESLGREAAIIVQASTSGVGTITNNIHVALTTKLGDMTLRDLTGEAGAQNFANLTPAQKRSFLIAYNELRNNLTELNSISQNAGNLARAFYESSMPRFKAQAEFTPPSGQEKFYEGELSELHAAHSKALTELTDVTPETLKGVGEGFAQQIEALQTKTEALSVLLGTAAEVESKVDKTLEYLTQGIDSQKALGGDDLSVVFIGADAADKIAGWVTAQTKQAREDLEKAKAENDPGYIQEATAKLSEISTSLHSQLDDVATLLNKLNAGKDASGNSTQGVRERIIAKATQHSVEESAISTPLDQYISALGSRTDSVIAEMFSTHDNSTINTRGLKEFVLLHHDRVEQLVAREANDGLTADEVKKALGLAEASLKKEPVIEKDRVDRANEDFEQLAAERIKNLNTEPKKSLITWLRNWLWNNN